VEGYEEVLANEISLPNLSVLENESCQRQRQMASLVEKKLAAMRDKEWKITVRGKSLEIRKQVDRVLKIVLAGKDLISSAASMDPIHAGLPWAGVCMLLPVSRARNSNDSDLVPLNFPRNPGTINTDPRVACDQ
jgi:hypothetical protein